MQELYTMVAGIDASAGAALRVIAFFDRLVAERAGLESLVRGAALLSGSPARLVDAERGIRIRVGTDGRRADGDGGPTRPAWAHAPVAPDGAAVLWLESGDVRDGVRSMVLERAAAAIGLVLDRTRGRTPDSARDGAALVEVLFDALAPEPERLRTAALLGLRDGVPARAIAVWGGAGKVEAAPATDGEAPRGGERREGVGPAVPLAELPRSWAAARTALRFTAEGTDRDPGPRSVFAEELGSGLTLLADAIGRQTPRGTDVREMERLLGAASWAPATVHAAATFPSLRAAADALHVHHSTLQARVAQLERLLGRSVRDPQGRLRLQLALAMWRLHRQPPAP
ncbi:helix-turn-helix domain-containing protein [Streptomyces sp. DW26H14]|uniref:helix-turn-helix domain-containing protein n=1 Tax=Streptomyces sp. DW26H14 TaxID=3435395 RepID=UPI00403D9628